MQKVYFISHPEVLIDKEVPVPDWGLSDVGWARLEEMLKQPWVVDGSLGSVFSSNENKARMAADRLAGFLNLEALRLSGLGEMDRSSTGRLDKEEFEHVVNLAFENPEESIRGWERLVDAQERIVTAVDKAIELSDPSKDIAIVSHGGVGTLMICDLKGVEIARSEDQPGQGHYFVFENIEDGTKRLVHAWKKIDEIV